MLLCRDGLPLCTTLCSVAIPCYGVRFFFVANKASVSLVGSASFALTSMVAMTLAIVNVYLVRHRYASLTGNVAKRCPPLKYLIPLWRGTCDQRWSPSDPILSAAVNDLVLQRCRFWFCRLSTLPSRPTSVDIHGAVFCLGFDAYQPRWLIGRAQCCVQPRYMFVYTVTGSNLR